MSADRNIGRVVTVDSLSVFVRLDEDIKSMYKSGYEEIYPVARINSYIIIPVGADRIVALVNRVMAREETDVTKTQATLFLTESNRYLSATMMGTIVGGKTYIQGVYNYPILDNPVWYATRADLDIIFDQPNVEQKIDLTNDYYLPIGTSSAFPDYQVKINPDKLFVKHSAILGNTGSGKSCTLTSIIQSLFHFKYNGQTLSHAHFIIFDTNGEYTNAFKLGDQNVVNPFYISQKGIKVPYWFMNFDDMEYLFEPTSGTQAPLLKRALALAKSKVKAEDQKCIPTIYLNKLKTFISAIEKADWTSNKAIYEESEAIYDLFNEMFKERTISFDLTKLCEALEEIKNEKSKLTKNKSDFIQGVPDCKHLNNAILCVNQELDAYRSSIIAQVSSENRDIDLPLYYDFAKLMSECFELAIKESSTSSDKLNEYVSTLKLRMQSFVDDIRLASPLLFNDNKDIQESLVKFLSYILGDFCKIYSENADCIYDSYYEESETEKTNNQITIIDMSLIPFQVLETLAGLIGRIILEFLSRFEEVDRGMMPVVLVLEEAQNYIPEINRKDIESISKRVFERIAREGRKYGLSLLISSQRPSELSKTVLSQCNSFVIHRIQNPDDQSYIRKLVSGANYEILNQMANLPQQHAIIMGDCVRTPIVARINTVSPKPNSNNPEFIKNWIDPKADITNYNAVVDKWLEQNRNNNQ